MAPELVAVADGLRESTESWAECCAICAGAAYRRRCWRSALCDVFPATRTQRCWVHLKTTNPVESTFATVRMRTRVTKGPGSRQAGLAMAFKLLEAAEQRWRAVNGPHLVALVRAGAVFRKGVLIARPEQDQEAAA
jgi:hypothetical protein